MISLSPRSVVSAVRLKPALAKKCTLPLSSKTGWRQGCLRGQARIPPGSLQDACLLRGWRRALQVACLNSWIQQVPLPHLVQAGRLPQGAVKPALRIKGFCDWTVRNATLPKLSLSDEEATASQGHMRSQWWLLVQNECVRTPWPPHCRKGLHSCLSLFTEAPSSFGLWQEQLSPLPPWERQLELFQMNHNFGFSFNKCLQWMKWATSTLYHVEQRLTWCAKEERLLGRGGGDWYPATQSYKMETLWL